MTDLNTAIGEASNKMRDGGEGRVVGY